MFKAIVGTASPLPGVITSYQKQIGWHLRAASLLVGLLVGLLSLVSRVKKLRRQGTVPIHIQLTCELYSVAYVLAFNLFFNCVQLLRKLLKSRSGRPSYLPSAMHF